MIIRLICAGKVKAIHTHKSSSTNWLGQVHSLVDCVQALL
jgi:hypothetical protein